MKNTIHNTSGGEHSREEKPSESAQPRTYKTYKTSELPPDFLAGRQKRTIKTYKTDEASERGLVATWSATFGYVAIHDPLTDEWHDIQTKQAPGWALAEASARKTLYKSGDHKAYSYNARKMEEIWGTEHPSPEESIEHPSPEEGIVEEYGIEAEDQYE